MKSLFLSLASGGARIHRSEAKEIFWWGIQPQFADKKTFLGPNLSKNRIFLELCQQYNADERFPGVPTAYGQIPDGAHTVATWLFLARVANNLIALPSPGTKVFNW